MKPGGDYTRGLVPAGAFFDLDRTVLSRSSTFALAGAFRDRELIRHRQLLQAALSQLLFSRFGAREDAVRATAERGMAVLAGVPVAAVEEIVEEAMEPALKPLVYREALELAELHGRRGEQVWIVSAALQQVVEALARELGFDGAIGSTCEVVDGVYTGRLASACYGEAKASALRELAATLGLDLARSTAYSDSHTDLAFLEAVGVPVAVNADRDLAAVAAARGWESLTFGSRAFPGPERRARAVALGTAAALTAGAAALAVRRREP